VEGSDDQRVEPTTARWGEQTRLAIINFPISGEPVPRLLIEAIALVKSCAAEVNERFGVLDHERAVAIMAAADEIVGGGMADQFPVDVFQSGSGTSTNMNVNEVVAQRATELCGLEVHPNDHVNASQSSNDVIPTAIRVAALRSLRGSLQPALAGLHSTLTALAERHRSTVKLGRTHLMDAVPMTFGQEVGAWARGVELASRRLADVETRLAEMPTGGTAIGTGLNTVAGFGAAIAERLAARTGLDLIEAVDHFEAQAAQDVLVELAGACTTVALTLHKIAGDLRLLGSGPTGGLGEVRLPELQAGSSIMPGKVNPVLCEVIQQVAAQVVGNQAVVTFAATAATLQITTSMPVMARAVLSSVSLLANATDVFERRCVRGIEVDEGRMRSLAAGSPALVTAIAPRLGYDLAARAVHRMRDLGETLDEALIGEAGVGRAPVLADVDLLDLTRPGRAPDTTNP
jgi:fumarate hydratase class II